MLHGGVNWELCETRKRVAFVRVLYFVWELACVAVRAARVLQLLGLHVFLELLKCRGCFPAGLKVLKHLNGVESPHIKVVPPRLVPPPKTRGRRAGVVVQLNANVCEVRLPKAEATTGYR